MRVITDDRKAEFERLWQNDKITIKMIAAHFGCSEYAVQTAATHFKATGRRRRKYQSDCHKCEHKAWCEENPHANRLPCEKIGTPYSSYWREINPYGSANGFWTEDANRRSID